MTEISREQLASLLDQAEAKIRGLYADSTNEHITVDPRSRGVENFIRPLKSLTATGHDPSVISAVAEALCAVASKPNADIVSASMLGFLDDTKDPKKIKAMAAFVRVLTEKDYFRGKQDYFAKIPRTRDKERRAQQMLNDLARKIG